VNEFAKQLARWGKICLGFLLIIIGIIGGFIPIMQGWMFVVPGLAILATEFTWARKVNEWVKSRFKKAVARVKSRRGEQKANEPG